MDVSCLIQELLLTFLSTQTTTGHFHYNVLVPMTAWYWPSLRVNALHNSIFHSDLKKLLSLTKSADSFIDKTSWSGFPWIKSLSKICMCMWLENTYSCVHAYVCTTNDKNSRITQFTNTIDKNTYNIYTQYVFLWQKLPIIILIKILIIFCIYSLSKQHSFPQQVHDGESSTSPDYAFNCVINVCTSVTYVHH